MNLVHVGHAVVCKISVNTDSAGFGQTPVMAPG